MEYVYIPLRAATSGNLSAETAIDLGQAVVGKKRALVLGAPGSGKSLFLRYLAWSLCARTENPASIIPVIVPLTRLTSQGTSIVSEIAAVLGDNGFQRATDFVSRDLAHKESRLLVLLDGLDECGSNTRLHVSNQIIQFGKAHPNARFIVTCRTAAYSGSLDGNVEEIFHVQDFDDELVDRFLYAWPALNARDDVDRLINALRDTPRVAMLVRNPLLLTMLAYLYSYEYKGSINMLPHNRTQFYRDATELLLRRWQEEYNKFPWMAKKVVLQHLALVKQRKSADRREMKYEDVLSEIKAVLPRVNIELDQADDLLSEIHERSGILTSLDNGERFQFAHLTLQEYFVAAELIDRPETMIQEYRRDQEAWREPLKLWCGGENDATATIRSILEVDNVLALECLADATRVDETFASQVVERMKSKLKGAAYDDPIVRAFGLVASDRRPRGRDAFEFLVRQVRSSAPLPSYAAALAASNLKEAADVLAELARNDRGLVPFLEQMGNLAVPGLARRAAEGQRDALRSLTTIATPRAAQALVAVLDNPSLPVARAAAIELTQLSASPAIEDALARLALPSSFARTEDSALAWAWEPFIADRPIDERQTLSLIFGRVIRLLESVSPEELADTIRPLDARIAIFVFSFNASGEPRNPINASALHDFVRTNSDRSSSSHISAPNVDFPLSSRAASWRYDQGTILNGLKLQVKPGYCELLRLAQHVPVNAFLLQFSRMRTHKRPTRREWLTLVDRKAFTFSGNKLYHFTPLVLVCVAATFATIFTFIAALHISGWMKYFDFGVGGIIALGLIFIAALPWHDDLDVWADAGDANQLALLSPILAFDSLINELDDLNSFSSGVAVIAFTPAWVYGFFLMLRFNGADILTTIVAEGIFLTLIAGLFLIGRQKESLYKANRFRDIMKGYALGRVSDPTDSRFFS